MRGVFVTSTDTGVGKTEVASALVRGHRARGLDVGAMKPAQSGHEPGERSDAERLWDAAGRVDPLELVCPHDLAAPLAPPVAARLEGKTISWTRILDCARALAARHAALVVEGAGGILAPLTERETCADLAVALGLPALVVARAGLGTVNHTALTCEALRARGVAILGVVVNRTTPKGDPSEPYNVAEMERLTGVRVLAQIPFVADIAERERRFAEQLASEVQF